VVTLDAEGMVSTPLPTLAVPVRVHVSPVAATHGPVPGVAVVQSMLRIVVTALLPGRGR
jgi:hypothetical protein